MCDTCRMVSLWAVLALTMMYRGVEGLAGCEVRVKPYVMDTYPSYMTWTEDPTVTPVVKVYMAFVDIDVQVTGYQPLKVMKGNLPICALAPTPVNPSPLFRREVSTRVKVQVKNSFSCITAPTGRNQCRRVGCACCKQNVSQVNAVLAAPTVSWGKGHSKTLAS